MKKPEGTQQPPGEPDPTFVPTWELERQRERKLAEAAQVFIDAIAERVVERLRQLPGLGSPLYATPKINPLGSRRAFLDAARRGDFPTFKRGRTLAANWSDVEIWMRSRDQRREAGQELSLNDELALASRPARRRKAV